MSSWFERLVPQISSDSAPKSSVPEGLWSKCPQCNSVLYRPELERSLFVCPKCEHHMPINARTRLTIFLDETETPEEIAADVKPIDILRFKDHKRYKDRLAAAQKTTGENDALLVMRGSLHGSPIVAASFDFRFMGGSMGSVVGEKFVRAVQASIEHRVPLVCFMTSGGARMQEALFSLMQMAKTSAALAQLAQHGLPFISVLTHPTTGGVSASLAMLGDINVAEPKALIGFAGPRVIKDTVNQDLPEGFQRSEFLQDHGVVDMIVDRRELRDVLHTSLSLLMKRGA